MDQTDDAITRSEEELEVHTRSRVVGRVRLRKRIVTETIQVSVEVRREELEIVQEDFDDASFDGASFDDTPLGEEVHTVVLSAEEPVVSLRVVPVERVHVHKELITEEREVAAELRSERVELEETPPVRG